MCCWNKWRVVEWALRKEKFPNVRSLNDSTKAYEEFEKFQPDLVLIWGDDQYENFKEDVIPPFCVQAYDDVEARPWQRSRFARNAWGEAPHTSVVVRGHRAAAKHVAGRLLQHAGGEHKDKIGRILRPIHFTNTRDMRLYRHPLNIEHQ
jgi:hypothetical protein